MFIIPRVKVDDDKMVGVPIMGIDNYCWIEWGEDETKDDALGRAYDGKSNHAIVFTKFRVSPSDLNPEDEIEGHEVHIYEVRCKQSENKYYMVSYWEIDEFDDIYHCVCLPYNRLNLLKFYAEYLCPLGMVKYRS